MFPKPFHEALDEFERTYFVELLAQVETLTDAAALCELERSNMKRRLRRLGVPLKCGLPRVLRRKQKQPPVVVPPPVKIKVFAPTKTKTPAGMRYDTSIVETAVFSVATRYTAASFGVILDSVRSYYDDITDRTVYRHVQRLVAAKLLEKLPGDEEDPRPTYRRPRK